jgi:hypothetical protein
MMREDMEQESRKILAAQQHGLVECSHCHRMVELEALGATCEACGADGCDLCIGVDGHGAMVCLDPFDSECSGAVEQEECV